MQIEGSIASISSVTVGTNSVEVNSNFNRKYLIIHNLSGASVYLAYGSTAAATAGGFSVILADGESYEVPAIYKGRLSAIRASGSGALSVTEIT